MEPIAERGRRAEADFAGDAIDRVRRGFEEVLRAAHPSRKHVLRGRRSRLLAEAAAQRSRAHRGPSRHVREREWGAEVLFDPMEQVVERRAVGRGVLVHDE